MIVERIAIEGYRCFVKSATVAGFGAGLNVVSAPNGTGKSTLFEALRRALIDHHSVSGVEAEKMRPWGRSISPSVTVDFAHGALRYRVHKRFLDDPSCELSRWEGDDFVVVDRGERADEKVRSLLSRPAAPKGLSREAHWGLAEVLWAPQGMIELGPLGPELATRVRETLAAQVVGARGAEIERMVEERFRAFFTPQTAKLKAGKKAPELVRRSEALALAKTAVDRARERHERAALTQERVGALRAELVRAERERSERGAQLAEREASLRAFDAKVSARAEAEQRATVAEAGAKSAKVELDAWRNGKAQLQERERRQADAVIALALAKARRDEAAVEVAAASERESRAARAHGALSELERLYRAARERARAEAVLADCDARIAAIDLEILRVEESRAALVPDAPTAADVASMRALEAARSSAKARLDALALTVTFDAKSPVTIEHEGEAKALSAGETLTLRALGALSAALDDRVSLTVRGPLSGPDAREAEESLQASAAALGALSRRFSASSADELDSLRAKAAAASMELRARERGLSTLGGAQARLALIERCREAVSTLELVVTDDRSESALAAELERARIDAEASGSIRTSAEARRDAERALAEREVAVAVAEERVSSCERATGEARAALDELARRGKSEAACQDAFERAALSLDVARVALSKSALELEGRAEIERAVREGVAHCARAEADALALRDAARTEEGRLDELVSGATFTVLARAEEEVTRLESEVARLEVEAEAVKLLREVLVRCRDEAIAKVSGEVERAAGRILGRIATGSSLEVELGETFAPTRAWVGAREGEGVALERLSGGEREQVHFAVRLALAEVLASAECAMVVLDDVLVATDNARLARVIEVLEDAAKRMQVIVLTCHPERYATAREATWISLAR